MPDRGGQMTHGRAVPRDLDLIDTTLVSRKCAHILRIVHGLGCLERELRIERSI